MSGHRHRAFWDIAAQEAADSLLAPARIDDPRPSLRPPSTSENVYADYAHVGLSLERHPLSLIRQQLAARRCRRSDEIAQLQDGSRLRFAGLVNTRQRPQTAAGVTFVTLEDETGCVNTVIWARLFEKQRAAIIGAQLLAIDGVLETDGAVHHLIADRVYDFSELAAGLTSRSRDFC